MGRPRKASDGAPTSLCECGKAKAPYRKTCPACEGLNKKNREVRRSFGKPL